MTSDGGSGGSATEQGQPSLFRWADALSIEGQRRALRSIWAQLLLLIVASAAGSLPRKVGNHAIVNERLPGLVSLLAFGGALAFLALRSRPTEAWYVGRVAAESIKTLSWKYMARGEPLDSSLSGKEVDELFLARVKEVMTELPSLPRTAAHVDAGQITSMMRNQRNGALAERMSFYRRERIMDQLKWYSFRAAANARSASRWHTVAVITTIMGLGGGILRTVWPNDIDLLNIAAAITASSTAWIETKQFRVLANSYDVAARELAAVNDELSHVCTEAEWSVFVNDAELAISREHSLWRTRRGV